MNVFEAIRARRSIRRYQNKPVETEKMNQVLDAARRAPSAKNWQDWRFIVVKESAIRLQLAEAACGQKFVAEAPVVIACCTVEPNYLLQCGQSLGTIDVSIAIDHMTLAAVALGLGTCWVGAFYEERVKQILEIPESVRIVELLTLGYPSENPAPRLRKPLEEIVFYESWKS